MDRLHSIVFIVSAVVIIPYVTCYQCSHIDGIEANLEDEGCETYWVCRHFVGVDLKKCPDGGQIDFRENKCKPNGDVWCQWQQKQLEESRSSDTRHDTPSQNTFVTPNHGPRSRDMTGNYYYYVDDNSNKNGVREGGRGGFLDYDDTYNNNHNNNGFYHDTDKWTYVCQTEWGHEPNLDDPYCRSFWRCDHFKGSLIQCKPGLVYDSHAKACRHGAVYCPGQHRHRVTSQSKHRGVGVKTNRYDTNTFFHQD